MVTEVAPLWEQILWERQRAGMHCRFTGCRRILGWRVIFLACSLHSTRDDPSESRFRAVQCYDDPTNDCGSGSDT